MEPKCSEMSLLEFSIATKVNGVWEGFFVLSVICQPLVFSSAPDDLQDCRSLQLVKIINL